MKTMIRSFASALVAVMTLGLVQTAQAEPCSIEQLVEPEGVCTITQDKTQAEGGEEVKFTISNIKEGYQVEDVKVFLYGEGGEIYPDYNYEEDYYSFNMPEENVYIYVLCVKPTTEYSITYNASPEAGGKVEGGPTSATAETVIGFTVTATNEAYAIDSVTAVWGSGTVDVKGGEGGYYWFDMPEGAVTVSATFVKAITGASISGCPESAVVGDSFQLAVNVEPSGEGVESYTTTWSSSNAAVATIDENGKVSVVGPGKVEFYAFVTGQRSGAELAAGVTCTAEAKKYSITIPKFDHGMVTSNVASTNEGATVTLTVTPDAGYELDTIKVDGIDPEKGEGSTYTFEMPASDVEVQATFKAAATKHTITTVSDPEGTCLFTVYPSEMEAPAGTIVEFRFDLADGANFVSLDVYNTDNPSQSVGYEEFWWNGQQWYRFTMPDYNVTIKVKTESGETPATAYNITTVADPEGTCLFTVSPESLEASEGAPVDFHFDLADGANFVSLTVYNTDNPAETISEEDINTYEDANGDLWYYFTMPDYNVTIKVKTESGGTPSATAHKISTDVTPSGACEVHAQESAQFGEEVYFEVGNFAAGATLGSLTVWNMSAGEQVKCEQTGKGYIFTMPDGDVLIEVVCSDPEPTTTVEVMPLARSYTSEIGAYTNGVLLTATPESTYIVNSNATVDVVFEANTSKGRYFKVNGVYTSIVTNTITASTDPYQFLGPLPDTGKKVGDSAYAFVDGGTCTIVGSGTADTRLSTVVSPGAITSVVIQPGITEVGARFFKGFKWLNAVTGGQDLSTVGTNAFYACFSLETITLDCTAVPKGMDGSVVYQTALKSDGSTYQIPEISVKNHVKMLFGKKSLDDADWTCLGPSEGKSIYEQDGYQFFQIRLVKDTGSKE